MFWVKSIRRSTNRVCGLEFLDISHLRQHCSHESEQFVERVKSYRLTRRNVLNLAFEKSGLDVGIGTKLDHESCPVLPSVHQKSTMARTCSASPKSPVSFR